jgi:hypothetical protein
VSFSLNLHQCVLIVCVENLVLEKSPVQHCLQKYYDHQFVDKRTSDSLKDGKKGKRKNQTTERLINMLIINCILKPLKQMFRQKSINIS